MPFIDSGQHEKCIANLNPEQIALWVHSCRSRYSVKNQLITAIKNTDIIIKTLYLPSKTNMNIIPSSWLRLQGKQRPSIATISNGWRESPLQGVCRNVHTTKTPLETGHLPDLLIRHLYTISASNRQPAAANNSLTYFSTSAKTSCHCSPNTYPMAKNARTHKKVPV